ncbi:baseplate wedge subunit protein [Rhizobium phage RHph_I46]|uniref:Baseplate wedge subunit protein n=1 Tax=Rhizobium phage RHph_I1_9 TaxID=2509729 RepID=A0A7S5R9I3_9CAUD|nr:baseplate wedge subunit [Rhizobium phage RHph_I1_9]QIG69625.1 baseplate wedge subunit protein [Rhizobium phage RHph_I46]QIG70906.1 baseplate wedge subunit protein [Rhizobium phage RHph_I9]QIG73492.1 baseplate wedge subunit protein [Rhizobium phage RHph_I1_9]QIG76245.1 baseplate wedge subunit protein [Rhizobium phage RHph_I34]
MADDSALRFRNHDFGEILRNLRDFMSKQDAISDYDVNASVVDILMSVLAYNTQNNSITGNVFFAEQDIDVAVQRKNIVKKAKEYGYVPYSIISSKASIDITVVPKIVNEAPSSITIDKGTQFVGATDTDPAIFTVVRAVTAPLVDGVYRFAGVELYQGTYGSVDIIVDKNIRRQIYEIKIDDIDMNFLEVYVQDTPDGKDFTEFKLANNSINVTGSDPVYFLQEVNEKRYGLEFGDGVFGKSVQDGVIVRVVFFKTLGEAGNGVKTFTFKASPDVTNKINQYTVSTITSTKSTGGLAAESNESIRRNAVKFYVSQGRAVNPSDYSDLIRDNFPYINSISVWSGVEGKGYFDQFGRTYIAANTDKSQFLTDSQKSDIYDFIINDIGTSGVIPILVDVDNIYIDISTQVFVDGSVTLKSSDIINAVKKYAQEFNDKYLNSFESIFEYSKFTAGVDEVDDSISSNDTTILIHKRVFPDTRVSTNFSTSFMNSVKNIVSNNFTYDSKTVFIKSTTNGDLNIYEVIDGKDILVKEKVGSIDFITGDLTVNEIVITRVNPQTKDLRFFAEPLTKNISSIKNNIVTISNIDVFPKKKK